MDHSSASPDKISSVPDHSCRISAMQTPSMDAWMEEARQDPRAASCGMYLFHRGVVRSSAKAKVRNTGDAQAALKTVTGMEFSCNREKAEDARQAALLLPGIYFVKIWLNEGVLCTGDDIMLVLIGGDIRPHVVHALQVLVGELKEHCVTEKELYEVR